LLRLDDGNGVWVVYVLKPRGRQNITLKHRDENEKGL
jgi:hypothetical protein